MALRLRRGTDAERLIITPVEGELIYTTDTKLLYAGDGSTAGGNLVAGGGGFYTTLDSLTDTNLSGAANNEVIAFNAGTNKWEPAVVPGISGFALNDIADVFINTGALAQGDVLIRDGAGNFSNTPKSEMFNDVANLAVSIVGNVTGDVTGDVIGNAQGSHTGTFDGEVTGSVFGDNSTLLVDGVSSQIVGDVNNNTITTKDIEAGPLTLSGTGQFGDRAGIEIISDGNADDGFSLLDITASKDGDVGSAINITRSRGTPAAKTGLNDEDEIMGINYFGYDSNNVQAVAAVIQVSVDGTPTAGYVPGNILFATSTDSSSPSAALNIGANKVSSFFGPAKFFSMTTAERNGLTPEAGMVVFNTTETKLQVYTGSAWTDLH